MTYFHGCIGASDQSVNNIWLNQYYRLHDVHDTAAIADYIYVLSGANCCQGTPKGNPAIRI